MCPSPNCARTLHLFHGRPSYCMSLVCNCIFLPFVLLHVGECAQGPRLWLVRRAHLHTPLLTVSYATRTIFISLKTGLVGVKHIVPEMNALRYTRTPHQHSILPCEDLDAKSSVGTYSSNFNFEGAHPTGTTCSSSQVSDTEFLCQPCRLKRHKIEDVTAQRRARRGNLRLLAVLGERVERL